MPLLPGLTFRPCSCTALVIGDGAGTSTQNTGGGRRECAERGTDRDGEKEIKRERGSKRVVGILACVSVLLLPIAAREGTGNFVQSKSMPVEGRV